MSTNPNAIFRELLADPAFLNKLRENMASAREGRRAFAASDIFKRMCAALKAAPGHVVTDSEQAHYFIETLQQEAGWGFASASDIHAFFLVMSDLCADGTSGHYTDAHNAFEHAYFTREGLHVFVMTGQGTLVQVSNQPFERTNQ